MRFFYNVIVGAAGLVALTLFCLWNFDQVFEAIVGAIAFAVFANLCFLAGPLAEFYISYFKKRSDVPEVRWPLFALGTGASLLPVLAVLISTIFS